MASITRPVANRAVHLRITPRPSNLGESREIMRLMSAFGEIEYFKNLRYDELSALNAALVIYKDETAAGECLRKSPIRFRMGRAGVLPRGRGGAEEAVESESKDKREETRDARRHDAESLPRGPIGTPFGLGAPKPTQSRRYISSQNTPNNPPQASSQNSQSSTTPPQLQEDDSRIFQILAHPSFRHFRDHINVNHYHGRFAIDTKMIGQGDLAKRVPTPGLSCVDWKATERPWHVVSTEREREKHGMFARRRLGELYKEGLEDQGSSRGRAEGDLGRENRKHGKEEEKFGPFSRSFG